MRVHYGTRKDPSFRCSKCGKIYYLPSGISSGHASLIACASEARARGWTIPAAGADFCDECTKGRAHLNGEDHV